MSEWIVRKGDKGVCGIEAVTRFIRCGECYYKMGDYCHCVGSPAFLKYVASNDYCRHATTEAEDD